MANHLHRNTETLTITCDILYIMRLVKDDDRVGDVALVNRKCIAVQ
jgi:hypothetical protein